MAGLNKFLGIGNLGRDPEMRYAANGDPVCTISIGITDRWKDKSGEKKEVTEWVRVVFFGKLAEIAGEYLKKGSQCYVEGKLQTRKWTDKDGNDKYTTEVVASELKLLGGRHDDVASGGTGAQPRGAEPASSRPAKPSILDDEEIPF